MVELKCLVYVPTTLPDRSLNQTIIELKVHTRFEYRIRYLCLNQSIVVLKAKCNGHSEQNSCGLNHTINSVESNKGTPK